MKTREHKNTRTQKHRLCFDVLMLSCFHVLVRNGGYAALTTTLLTVIVSLTIIGGFTFFSFQEVNTNRAFTKSIESHYVSEGGVEDAVYRVITGKQFTSPEIIPVGNGTTTVTLTTTGNQRIIRSEGRRGTIQQNLETRIDITSQGISFVYGAQVGDDGIEMSNNSQIVGSVYSDGDITGDTGANITGDAFVAVGTPSTLDQSWTTQNADFEVGKTTGSINRALDSAGDVGKYTSIILGSDGFPRITYYDETNKDLKFIRCLDVSCSSKNTTVVDSGGDVGWRYTSVAAASDGFARISYYDATNKDLKFARCLNADCTVKNLTAVDTSGDVGQFSSMMLGSDGFARISYYNDTNQDLDFAHCTNADCITKNISTVDSTGDTGKYTSVTLASDGFARISYRDETNKDLKFARCQNLDCSSAIITTVDTAGDLGSLQTSLALGSDGFARISYYNDTNQDLDFAHCTNADCSSRVVTIADSAGNRGKYSSLKLGSDGFPRISYWGDGALQFMQCTNADCTAKNISAADSFGNDVGHYTSLILGTDGFGRISYYDNANGDLRFTLCLDAVCSPTNPQVDVAQSFQPSVTDKIKKVELYLKKIGSPQNATLRLIKNSSGSPSTNPADVLATAVISSSLVGTSYNWISLDIAAVPILTANTTYWLVIDSSFDNTNYFVWGQDAAGGYTRGSIQKSVDWTQGGWISISGDLDFRTYMDGADHQITNVSIGGNANAHIINNSTITGNANTFNLSNSTVNGNVSADSVSNCTINGTAAYNTKTICTIIGTETSPNIPPADPPHIPLPITDAVITDWKNSAASGGTCSLPQCLANGDFAPTACAISLGPKKITGNMILNASCSGGQTLTITGTVWVQGAIDISNNAKIILDPQYGALSGVIIADGTIHLANNGQFSGSGTPGSYLMFLTTVTGGGHHGSAIDFHNNATGAIFYAQNGMIYLHNNVQLTSLVGKKVHLENNAKLIYDLGLQNAKFSAGPSAGADIKYWKEVE